MVAFADGAGSALSQMSMASPATTYPAPWMASTGMMPANRLR